LYAKVQKRNGREYHHYACLGKKIKGAAFCSAPNIPRQVLDKQVELEILARYGDLVSRDRFRAAALESLEQEARTVAAGLAETDQRIARIEAQERQVRLEYREQTITTAEFRALRKDLLEDLQGVRANRQQLLARQTEVEQQRVALSARLQALDQVDRWGELEPHQQKNLLRCFVHELSVGVDPAGAVNILIAWH
jgi:chromosome segregation ATPase